MVITLVALALSSTLQESPLRDRATFIKALSTIRNGMTEAQVRRILGPPDDVSRPTDIRPEGLDDGTFWSYGTNGHLTFATLGRVRFEDGRTSGDWSRSEGTFVRHVPELQLRRTLRELWPIYTTTFDSYDPLWTVRATNALLPLGKDGALCAMEELLRCGTDMGNSEQELFWLMRTLFEVPKPPGYWHVPSIGGSIPRPPEGEEHLDFPLFPIALVLDVPFKLTGGTFLAGVAERPTDEISRLKKEGRLRSKPLSPPSDPFLAYQRLVESRKWPDESATFDQVKRRLQLGVLDLVRTAYRPADFDERYFFPSDEEFETCHQEFLKIGARWSDHHQMYVRGDGTADPVAIGSEPE